MIHFIIPPVSDCFMPTLGVAQIAGYLKSHDIEYRVHDANAELLYILWNQWGEKNGREYSYKNVVECLAWYSSVYKGVNISTDDFRTDFQWRELDKLQEYVMEENDFSGELKKLSFMQEECASAEGEELYGLSISYDCQVIPAMLLARIIKEKKPGAKVCIGGSLLYNYEHDFYKLAYMTDWIDVLIVGAGEEVWKYMGKGELEKLDALSGINVRNMQEKYVIDMRERKEKSVVYEPDFSGFHFEYYLSEEKAFPYMIKDRCYYGKCYFCNGDRVETQVSVKDIRLAFEKMHKITEDTGIRNVYLVDAALSPKDMEMIAKLPDMGIRWIANGRFEKNLAGETLIAAIAQRGCVMLRFGLESASQKVLDNMNKGTKISVAETILNLTARYGISNHVYLMFGYPGEEKEDREMTIAFMERNRSVISSYSVSLFQPIPGTVIYHELLKKIDEKENAYEHMIRLIYKDENYYAEIYEDISRLNDVLRGHAKTNVEYYSANIFNRFLNSGGNAEKENSYSKESVTTKEEVQREISIQFSPENKF